MKKRVTKGFWIWGQFDNQSTINLNKIYKNINDNLKGPLFEIHLTLSGPIKNKNKEIINKFFLLKKMIELIEIETVDYLYSENYYESLFIKIKKSNELMDLKFTIDKIFNLSNKEYNPHISLFYGNTLEEKKLEIISKISKPPKRIKLKKLCLVNIEENINKWKIEDKIVLNNS